MSISIISLIESYFKSYNLDRFYINYQTEESDTTAFIRCKCGCAGSPWGHSALARIDSHIEFFICYGHSNGKFEIIEYISKPSFFDEFCSRLLDEHESRILKHQFSRSCYIPTVSEYNQRGLL